jgi:exonuclease VII small subunit
MFIFITYNQLKNGSIWRNNNMAHPGGRPTTYSKELAEQICKLISTDPRSIFELSEQVDWFPPSATFYGWLNEHKEFSENYSRAQLSQCAIRLEQAQKMINDRSHDFIKDDKGRIVSNNIWANSVRAHVNFNQWKASKLLAAYADKKLEENQERIERDIEIMKAAITKKHDEI